ncbi:MAG: alpha/beta fold hydrolase [Planctomycetota bacterium]
MLVPGNDLSPPFYRPLCERLAAHGLTTTAVHVPAFVGQGPAASWDDLVERLLADLALHQPAGGALIGHSLGGLLAFLAAARRPPQVQRLVLLEPAIAPWAPLARAAARTYRRAVVERDRDRFVNWTGSFRRVARPARFPGWALELYLQNRRAADPERVGALLDTLGQVYPLPIAEVEVPVLLLRGASSGWRAALGQRALRGRFRDARVEVIPRAAHWLANEADEAVAAAVVRAG